LQIAEPGGGAGVGVQNNLIGIESHLHLAAICKTFDPERDYQSFYSAI